MGQVQCNECFCCAAQDAGVVSLVDSVAYANAPDSARRDDEGEGAKSPMFARMDNSPLCNIAFVFIKPNADSAPFREHIAEKLRENDFTFEEGDIEVDKIDTNRLIDRHYYEIASTATLQKPEELELPTDKSKKFLEKFDFKWEDALEQEKLFNALDACEKLNIDMSAMGELWDTAVKQGRVIQLDDGVSCGKIEPSSGDALYVFNGFFMSLRAKFTERPLHYYTVGWDANKKTWSAFRNEMIGERVPEHANPDSLRATLYNDWEELGLLAEPDGTFNGVHASASPFEGLAERCNWLQKDINHDHFGRRLLSTLGEKARQWILDGFTNPQVAADASGQTVPLFDELRDLDAEECIARIKTLYDLDAPRCCNEAFVFVKPHAITQSYRSHVKEVLTQAGIKIVSEGEITARSQQLMSANNFKRPLSSTLLNSRTRSNDSLGSETSGLSLDVKPEVIETFSNRDEKIYYYVVRWEVQMLSWKDFRAKIVGPTEPASAPPDSLRGYLHANWRSVELKEPPNEKQNGVHASASPLEGLRDRCKWLSKVVESDPFGKKLINAGIDGDLITQVCRAGDVGVPGGGTVFATVQDQDSDACVDSLVEITESIRRQHAALIPGKP